MNDYLFACYWLPGSLDWWSEQHGHRSPQLVQPRQQRLGGVVWLLQTGAQAGAVAGEAGAGGLVGVGGGRFGP